jgi:hypothetical protein
VEYSRLTYRISSPQQLASRNELLLRAGIKHLRVIDKDLQLQILPVDIQKEEQPTSCADRVDPSCQVLAARSRQCEGDECTLIGIRTQVLPRLTILQCMVQAVKFRKRRRCVCLASTRIWVNA